jgi:hypothetical protein
MTISGVDAIAGMAIVAAVGEFHRFPDADRLVAYVGPNGRISKAGRAQSAARTSRRLVCDQGVKPRPEISTSSTTAPGRYRQLSRESCRPPRRTWIPPAV